MTRPPWEVADIIRWAGGKFLERYCDSLTWTQLKVLRAIARCRTAALGGHRDQCVRCGHQAISYNSCRNRHCPKCQTNAREKWLCARRRELLPVCYFHLVFSVPHALVPLIWQNKRYLFGLLFDASAATLLEVAADPLASVPRSASLAFCIRGDRLCSDTRTSTVSYRVGDCRLITRGGSARHPTSFYQ